MGRGRKMKVPEIDAIVSVTCSGAAHKVQRASYDFVEESYALVQVLTCTSRRTQGFNSQRGSPSMRERSQDVRRHLSEAAHPANLGAKFALRSAIHRREHDHHRCACAQSMLSGSSGRISHPSLKLPPPRPGSAGPGQQHPARSSAPGRDRGVLPACCHRRRKQQKRQMTRLPDCGQASTSGPA